MISETSGIAVRNRPVAVLVDAYTSGKYLAPAFVAAGADVVHVQSTPEFMPSMPPPDLKLFLDNIVHEDVDQTAAELARYAPVCVLAGQEPGVLLADTLAERMGVPCNGTRLSPTRRDKYQMIETVRAAGLLCASQFKSGDTEDLVDWAERQPGYPVVVKPLRSAAGDCVYICGSASEVRSAAKAILASNTIYGETNSEALAQSYLPGTEYVVDMVSYAGQRYVCGVWEYQKKLLPSGRSIYDRERLLPESEPPVPGLIAYVSQVLQALGVNFGPTHAEVIGTPGGPALVEVGARIAGNMHPGFHDECAGGNQAALTALAYLAPDRFLDEYGNRRYQQRGEAICCTTSTGLYGLIDSIDEQVLAEISGLPTVYGVNLKLAPGDWMRPTVDLYSSTMRIFMHGGTMAEIDRDYRRIGELKDRVYQVRDDG